MVETKDRMVIRHIKGDICIQTEIGSIVIEGSVSLDKNGIKPVSIKVYENKYKGLSVKRTGDIIKIFDNGKEK